MHCSALSFKLKQTNSDNQPVSGLPLGIYMCPKWVHVRYVSHKLWLDRAREIDG